MNIQRPALMVGAVGVLPALVLCGCCGCHCFVTFMLCRQKHSGMALLSGMHAKLASFIKMIRVLKRLRLRTRVLCAVMLDAGLQAKPLTLAGTWL